MEQQLRQSCIHVDTWKVVPLCEAKILQFQSMRKERTKKIENKILERYLWCPISRFVPFELGFWETLNGLTKRKLLKVAQKNPGNTQKVIEYIFEHAPMTLGFYHDTYLDLFKCADEWKESEEKTCKTILELCKMSTDGKIYLTVEDFALIKNDE